MSGARRVLRTISLLAAGALVLTGCTSDEPQAAAGSTTAAEAKSPPLTLTYAYDQEFISYNNNTAAQAAVANSIVLNQVLRGFWLAGPNGQIVADTEFGTYTQVASNPLTIRYTFAEGAIWSDGEPIDCDDAVLAWAANSGRWPTGKRDPDTGAKLSAFSSARPGAWANVGAPVCAEGDRSFTVSYETVYADWASLFGPGTILPAHVVEKESRVPDLIAAVKADQAATMTRVGDTYNSLWLVKPGEYKTDVSPSAGPYQVAAWEPRQSVTLKVNPTWWGRPPKADTVVIRYIAADRQAEALRNGTVQVIDPSPTPEMVAELAEQGSAVKVSMHDSFTWEHLDFSVDGVFRSKELRRAFAKCVPRQQIVDNLVKPQNPNAAILQSRFLMPFQPGYANFAQLGGQEYTAVDIAGAKQILEAEDQVGARVRIAYQKPNLRRKAQVDLIRDSCSQAGFSIVDAGTTTFFGGALERPGDFDVALFAWTGSPLLTQGYTTYMTDGLQNKGGYSNPQVDQLLKRLYSELDINSQQRLLAEIDGLLWSDLATIPLFAFPAMLATAGDIEGVQFNPSAFGLTYNLQDWTRRAS